MIVRVVGRLETSLESFIGIEEASETIYKSCISFPRRI